MAPRCRLDPLHKDVIEMPKKHCHYRGCKGTCHICYDINQAAKSKWDPAASQAPDVGTVASADHVVSFKTGGPQGDETLIADGDYSDDKRGFDGPRGNRGHNHYGAPDGDHDRGKYTGPDH